MKPFTYIYSFARKIGQAFAGGLGGFAIRSISYNAADKIQSEAVVQGIHTVATLVLPILFLSFA